MNFRQKNNFGGKIKKSKISSIHILTTLFLIAIFSFSPSRSFLFSLTAPLWNTKNNLLSFLADSQQLLKSKQALIEENNTFKKQITDAEKDRLLNGIIRKENDDIKALFNRRPSHQEILAAVLVKPFLSAYDTLIIDAGTVSGVSVGDKVLAENTTFIGYVSDVYSDSAKVVLYSSPGEKVKVLIGKNNVEKEAVGLGGGNFSVEMPRESDIKEGDNIVIPSLSPNIFSVVEKLNFKEADSFQTVLFKSPINMNELKWVQVLPSIKK